MRVNGILHHVGDGYFLYMLFNGLMEKMLTKLLKEKGWSETKLAKETGLSSQHVNQLARGLKNFTLQTANTIAKVLGVAPHVFMPDAIYSPDEQDVLNYYRALTDGDRNWVIDFLKIRVESQKPAASDDPLITPPAAHITPSHKGKS